MHELGIGRDTPTGSTETLVIRSVQKGMHGRAVLQLWNRRQLGAGIV
jgi:hypothetical protein